jgi:Na+/H+ antiporter NhaD/arsenite permease-like protein
VRAGHGPRARAPIALLALVVPAAACAAADAPAVLGIRIEFLIFAATLIGVAVLHARALTVALAGLAAITAYALAVAGFHEGAGLAGLLAHLQAEWVIVVNLFALLVGFSLLTKHFEESRVPELLPDLLPRDWKGGFALLCLVFVLSAFLDNIAAALIGGTVARSVFRGRLQVGFLAAIVAAANAGGAGSVVGDTTTTMMWIAGVDPRDVLHAYVASAVGLLVFGVPASLRQQRHAPIVVDAPSGVRVDWARVVVVAVMLAAAIAANVFVNVRYPEAADAFPYIGAAVWLALLACAPLRPPAWRVVPAAAKSSAFLVALVLCASMMPVQDLPAPSVATAFGLGVVSSVFDNIPLTKLALEQDGYDWGVLAYAVGFGGSMIWFGSSAGVALSAFFPEARSVARWLREGWHVAVAYVAGFASLWLLLGWDPDPLAG